METKKIGGQDTHPVTPFGTQPELKPPLKQTTYDGTLLKDRYLIEGELGRGGIGIVYLARDMQLLGRRVVIKVLLQDTEASMYKPWFKKKFEQEIEALVRLDHPSIVGVLDAGEMPDGKPFFVMQFVEGVTLRSSMNSGPMDFARVAQIVRQIGNALNAAHDKGIIHRDLKPENVMVQTTVDGEDIVKLIDFGIASVKDSQVATAAEKTKVAGALPYMAPEQLRGQPEAASDVWALGVIAYEMLTGRVPFVSDSLVLLHDLQRQGLEVKPSQFRAGLHAAADRAILKALSFDPHKRQARAKEFGDELSRAMSDTKPPAIEPVHIGPSDPTMRLPADVASEGVDSSATTSAPTMIGLVAEPPPEILRQPKPPGTLFKLIKAAPVELIGAALLVVAFIGAFVWISRREDRADQLRDSQSGSPTGTAPSRLLNYSIRVRLNPEKNPNKPPVQLGGEVIFSPGDELCFNFNSPQDGYLYIINEGPVPAKGLPQYNVLFPDPKLLSANTPSLRAKEQLFIPSEQPPWFPVDREQGTEKLWLVWSERAITEMETVRKWLNEKDRGEVKDANEIRMVRQFLNQSYSAARPVAEKDEHQTFLKGGKDGVLVYPVKLEHR